MVRRSNGKALAIVLLNVSTRRGQRDSSAWSYKTIWGVPLIIQGFPLKPNRDLWLQRIILGLASVKQSLGFSKERGQGHTQIWVQASQTRGGVTEAALPLRPSG